MGWDGGGHFAGGNEGAGVGDGGLFCAEGCGGTRYVVVCALEWGSGYWVSVGVAIVGAIVAGYGAEAC